MKEATVVFIALVILSMLLLLAKTFEGVSRAASPVPEASTIPQHVATTPDGCSLYETKDRHVLVCPTASGRYEVAVAP